VHSSTFSRFDAYHNTLSWHSWTMAGDEIDRVRAKSAMAVVKEHPGMVLFLASPGIIAVAAVWWLAGAGWAGLLLIALVLGGGAALRKAVSKK
jgi:hypothetical protein